jgi:hypothetical protein
VIDRVDSQEMKSNTELWSFDDSKLLHISLTGLCINYLKPSFA